MFEGNASYFYVGNVVAGSSDAAAIDTIAAGSVSFCTEDGKIEEGAASTGIYRVAQKLADGNIVFSPFFDMATRKNVAKVDYVAPQQQVTYFGYNGTSGALDATANADYVLHFEWLNSQFTYNNTPMVLSAAYRPVAASQYELADGMLKSFNGMMNRQPYKFIVGDAINNAAVTAANCLDNDAQVVNGVAAFTITTALVYNTGAGTLAAGDYVRLLSPTASATTLVSPVYKVISAVDNGASCTVVVDRPITCATGTYAAAADELELIQAASIGANWGFKFVGVENANFNAINDTFDPTRFKITNSGFSTAAVTYTTPATKGLGYGKELAGLETYGQFLDKSSVVGAFPQIARRQEVVNTRGYDVIAFEINALTFTSPTTGIGPRHSFRITMATNQSDTDLSYDSLDTVLGI